MHERGQTLVEVILAIFLFAVLGTGFAATLITSAQTAKRGMEHTVATGYIKEGIEAVRSIRDRDWVEMVNGTHGLSTLAGFYDFAGSSDALGVYTRTTTIEDVYRVGSLTGDIAASGVFDAATKRVTVSVSWLGTDQHVKNLDAVFYVTNWSQQSWVQTLTADFTAGFQNSSQITTTGNGEMQLAAHDTDWDNTQVQHTIDLAGSGDRIESWFNPVADILYTLAQNTAGDDFEAYDMSDVSENTPAKLGGYDIQSATDFVVSGAYAYISTTDNTVEVDIVDVRTMTRVATIDLLGSADATAITVSGTTLVVGRESSGENELWFYNVAVPSSPALLFSTNVSATFNDLAASATHAFGTSSNNDQEIYAFQISDGTQVGTLDMAGGDNAQSIALLSNNLYVTRDDGSNYDFALVDVTDPAAMAVVSTLELGESPNNVAVDTNEAFAFLATDNNSEEVIVVNLATFAREVSLDTTGGDDAMGVQTYGGHVYASGERDVGELMILRVTPVGWESPVLVASLDKQQNHDAEALTINGTYAYLVTNNNDSHDDFFIIDITSPASPVLLGSLNLGTDVTDVIVSGNYAYVSTASNSEELMVIDVTVKTSPIQVASYNAAGTADGLSVALSGSTVFLSRADSGSPELYVITVTNPLVPFVLGTFEFGDDLNAIVIDGSYLFAATDADAKELLVVDVSNPAGMSEAGSYNASGSENGKAIDVSGSTLALGRANASGDELFVIDVSSPGSPTLLGSVEVGDHVNGVSLDGASTVYLATEETGMEFMRWDISAPASPVLDASLDLSADAQDVVFNGSYAFIASSHDTQELQVIGEGAAPAQYAPEASFTSQAFDAGSAASWDAIEWTASGTGTVAFRIRTAASLAGLVTATWVGQDGTSATTYSVSGAPIMTDPSASGTQFVQWKAYLSGNGTSTPVISDVTLRYSP